MYYKKVADYPPSLTPLASLRRSKKTTVDAAGYWVLVAASIVSLRILRSAGGEASLS